MHIFLSPHIGDAILSCGGKIASLTRRGEKVIILTVMAGDPTNALPESPLINYYRNAAQDLDSYAQQRRTEDAYAAMTLGAKVYHFPFINASFRTCHTTAGNHIALYPTKERQFEPINKDDDTRTRLLATALPFNIENVTCIYAPLGVSHHVDHLLTRDWALVLAGPTRAPMLKLYASFPYARTTAEIDKTLQHYKKHLPALLLRNDRVILDAGDVEKKLQAIRSYKTRLDPENIDDIINDVQQWMHTLGANQPVERYWQVMKESQITTQQLVIPHELENTGNA